jgi:hypothetical protein
MSRLSVWQIGTVENEDANNCREEGGDGPSPLGHPGNLYASVNSLGVPMSFGPSQNRPALRVNIG